MLHRCTLTLLRAMLLRERCACSDARATLEQRTRGVPAQVGVFEMKEEGLVAVPNPSASFLGDRTLSANASSAVTVMIEGTRPLLLEVQALCSPVHQVCCTTPQHYSMRLNVA